MKSWWILEGMRQKIPCGMLYSGDITGWNMEDIISSGDHLKSGIADYTLI